MISRTFLRILDELGWPNVYLVDPEQFKNVDGVSIDGSFGIASVEHPIISIEKGLRGRALRNTIYHEIGHHLFPHRPHWWIECAAERLANGGGRGCWSKKYGHTVDEMPTRVVLLNLFKKASKRFNDGQYS